MIPFFFKPTRTRRRNEGRVITEPALNFFLTHATRGKNTLFICINTSYVGADGGGRGEGEGAGGFSSFFVFSMKNKSFTYINITHVHHLHPPPLLPPTRKLLDNYTSSLHDRKIWSWNTAEDLERGRRGGDIEDITILLLLLFLFILTFFHAVHALETLLQSSRWYETVDESQPTE